MQLKQLFKVSSLGHITNFSYALEVVTCPARNIWSKYYSNCFLTSRDKAYFETEHNQDVRRQVSHPWRLPSNFFVVSCTVPEDHMMQTDQHVTHTQCMGWHADDVLLKIWVAAQCCNSRQTRLWARNVSIALVSLKWPELARSPLDGLWSSPSASWTTTQ